MSKPVGRSHDKSYAPTSRFHHLWKWLRSTVSALILFLITLGIKIVNVSDLRFNILIYFRVTTDHIVISEIAVTPNNQEIRIYQLDKSANDWALLDTLNKHDLRVTGIDWAPKTNRIVTCSEVNSFHFLSHVVMNLSNRNCFLGQRCLRLEARSR